MKPFDKSPRRSGPRANQPTPLHPRMSLLVKLGSIVVHADEATTPNAGHAFDVSAIRALLGDAEVQQWLAEMRTDALLPVKR